MATDEEKKGERGVVRNLLADIDALEHQLLIGQGALQRDMVSKQKTDDVRFSEPTAVYVLQQVRKLLTKGD